MRKGMYKDLTGRTFGKLEVLTFAGMKPKGGKDKTEHATFTCQCSCGSSVIRYGHDLTAGLQSCGCAHSDAGARNRKGTPEQMIIIRAARQRAKQDHIPFDITPEDIDVPETCPILGIPLFRSKGTATANSPSLDKIVPSKGYVKGNVWVISHRANTIKQDATPAELMLVARTMESLCTATQ